MNRYVKAGLNFDDSLKLNQPEDHTAEFEEMRKLIVSVAERLLAQDDGVYAVINNYPHWISPIRDRLELIFGEGKINNGVLKISGLNAAWKALDFRSANDMNDFVYYKQDIERWLANPVYYFADQDDLDDCALGNESMETAHYTRQIIQAIKELQALNNAIVAGSDSHQVIVF